MDFFSRLKLWYETQPPALRLLLTINVVFYLVFQIVLSHIPSAVRFTMLQLALHPDFPGILAKPWQLVTYNFMHTSPGLGGFLHILFNMLWLVWIGRDFERMHGSHRMFAVYMLGGIGGGVLSVILNSLFPGSGFFAGPIVGASGSVLGVLAGVATFYPQQSIGLLFIGNVRLPVLVGAFLFLDLLFLSGSRTAVGAHLGGALSGFLWARGEKSGVNLSGWATAFFASRRSSSRSAASNDEGFIGRLDTWLARRARRKGSSEETGPAKIHRMEPRPEQAPPDPQEDVVNQLLDKISEDGYDALTEDEKRILYEASKK